MTIKPDITYGKTVFLCDGQVAVSGCATPEEADLKVKDLAQHCGYKPPPRWKFWDQKTWVRI